MTTISIIEYCDSYSPIYLLFCIADVCPGIAPYSWKNGPVCSANNMNCYPQYEVCGDSNHHKIKIEVTLGAGCVGDNICCQVDGPVNGVQDMSAFCAFCAGVSPRTAIVQWKVNTATPCARCYIDPNNGSGVDSGAPCTYTMRFRDHSTPASMIP